MGIKIFENTLGKLKAGDKKVKWITVIGLIGIACICLSQFWPASDASAPTQINGEVSGEAYVEQLEQRIHQLISSIDGVGNSNVMVTLENGVEYIYEKEETKSSTLNRDSSNGEKLQQNSDYNEKYVIINDSGGEKSALIRTTLEPKVRGVVIVCEGGDRAAIVEQITDVVTTALHLNYSQVCVSKLAVK